MSMRAVYDDGLFEDTGVFICPSSGTEAQVGRFVSEYECILDRVDEKIPTELVDDMTTPLAWDNTADRHDGVCVVYVDPRIHFITGPNPYEDIRQQIEGGLSDELEKQIVWQGAIAPQDGVESDQ
ncbi:MAG: hypothetical protein ACOC8E_02335 [Planctomycetota bacterium]